MKRLILAIAVVLLAGCGAAPDSPDAPSMERAERFAALFREFHYDFVVLSPAEQRDEADLVVIGSISKVVEGRDLAMGRGISHANLIVQVDQVVKGSLPGDTVYVEVPVSKVLGVSWKDIEAAAPSDRVLLFLDERTDQVAVGREIGRPDGAKVFTPFQQGLIIEARSAWVSGLASRDDFGDEWSKLDSFAEVVAAVK